MMAGLTKEDRQIVEALSNHGFDGTETELNRKALAAVHGFSSQPERDLRNLFRSSDPIHSVVRCALADAFDGETIYGTSLALKNGGANRDLVFGIESRERRLAIGRWIESERISRTKIEAIENAAAHFASTFDTCESAHKYWKRCTNFVKQELKKGSDLSKYGNSAMETAFHLIDQRNEREKRGRKRRGR